LLPRWPAALLFVPALLAIWQSKLQVSTLFVAVSLQIAWTLWCLWPKRPQLRFLLPQGVAGLLAGIALVDWVAAPDLNLALIFLGLFLFALLLQRIAPAT
jgi:hypothetical protein